MRFFGAERACCCCYCHGWVYNRPAVRSLQEANHTTCSSCVHRLVPRGKYANQHTRNGTISLCCCHASPPPRNEHASNNDPIFPLFSALQQHYLDPPLCLSRLSLAEQNDACGVTCSAAPAPLSVASHSAQKALFRTQACCLLGLDLRCPLGVL